MTALVKVCLIRGVSSGVVAPNNDSNCGTKVGQRKHDDIRNKCHRCLEQIFDGLTSSHMSPSRRESPLTVLVRL